MKLKEYLNLICKIKEKEEQIKSLESEIYESDSICLEHENKIKEIVINYIKGHLSKVDKIKINFGNINNMIYFSSYISYNPTNILNGFFETKVKELGISDEIIIREAVYFLSNKYYKYNIEKDIIISYDNDTIYFLDIKRFFNLFEIDLNKIDLNDLVNTYEENIKFTNLFEKEKIAELNKLMIFK